MPHNAEKTPAGPDSPEQALSNEQVDAQIKLIRRGIAELINEDDLRAKIARGRPLRVKVGFDPTAPDLHLGHSVILHKMRQLQELGHQIVFLIGDFTGLIGDPSGRSETRPALTEEQILANAETYKKQVFKILEAEKTQVLFNSGWHGRLNFAEVIRLASRYTVARLLERDDFAKRVRNNQPIAVHELLYPLAQGYDSVALKTDIELGGTDQTFNLLVGRHLQAQYGLEPQCVITLPLLEGLDGVKKMSKSLRNYVGIDEPATQIFGKIMSVSDELMWRYFELLSTKSMEEISLLRAEVEAGRAHPKTVKESLAFELAARFHDAARAEEARRDFNAVFTDGGVPEDAPEYTCVEGEASAPLAFLSDAGLAASRGEVRRLVAQKALSVDGKLCEDALSPLARGSYVIKLGRKRFLRLTVRPA
ncbi:MAG: tyrosine--tRNA ligase [Deltaproteobacteria bacterium]|jgi:tyrosyl-tRNA synthetase|nr:tyrosine--tRNA ligase [Deltaproteobacteria bacterium]